MKYLEPTLADIAAATDLSSLDQVRIRSLGKKGWVTQELASIKDLPVGQRAKAGKEANDIRIQIEARILERKAELETLELLEELKQETVDVTAPTQLTYGHAHPALQVTDDIVRTFEQMGYVVANGPEIETEWYNFEALNIPADHPARDMQDTFYLKDGRLPRTHTSGVQVRYMQEHKPPIRIVAPGKVYRNEDEDARHSWMFYQIEGLAVDKGITLADLKGTLLAMARGVFGPDTNIRLRPNYFPYTEPSVEMDATCVICSGEGCATCTGTGWLELGGAGMVHPQVLRNVGLDPAIYSGFAFGFGPERMAVIKYQVPDVREFWRPNLNFLEQF